MSNVQALPRFRVNEVVDLYTDPELMDGVAGEGDGKAVYTATLQIHARYHVDAVGWIYRLSGVHGLMEERWLRRTSEQGQRERDALIETVSLAELNELIADNPFQWGQVVRIVHVEGLTEDEQWVGMYGLITGMGYINHEITYSCAMRHAEGHYLDIQEEFFAEELVAASTSELAQLSQSVTRRKLSIVPSA